MGFKLEISVKARLDVQDAVNWYNAQVPNLGRKFTNDFRAVLRYIQKVPFSFRKLNASKREAPLKIFPYLIIYEIRGSKIIVLGVFGCF
ncbi:ParE toxin of type II toxin-antitoxin system, parDE [Salegentibacter echinorum]|uniref:ParE toxin of type II toxin-antitoxin system, parDE n=1 Tax=Salegentibacter echinorum TaxID=1073325 RepID=A0A1M5DPQ6_SALEC|nr:type II toxin-antitoxin system RelE/ParE family toxin [Salegentibacter echinorum]SHF68886.1 ParE toxin of type II toxin-antitoxin system, parDE [Salegentibacter echinorum]